MWVYFITALYLALWSWAVFRLLTARREPSSTLAWLLFVTFAPIVGAVSYLIFGSRRLVRKAHKRKNMIASQLADAMVPKASRKKSTENRSLPPEARHVINLASKISEYPITEGNFAELLTDPRKTLSSMRAEIKAAKDFIHLEYYIIDSDEVTEQLFDDLAAAARRGVEVRVLYDSLGSLSLKRWYFRKLTQNGVKAAGFLPFSFLPQRMNFNFRNHRKILVIDGKVAFTGGANIGKKYLGRRSESQWRDTTTKVMGPVCQQLEDVFAKDWHFTTEEDLFQERYYPSPSRQGDLVIQMVESGPDSPFYTLHHAVFHAMSLARRNIRLSTPYFIPDPAITSTLSVAALRGIHTQVLLPAKTDAKLVQFASRSFYEELMEAGVEIYEYQPRMLHSKLLVIDDRWSIIGSGNMDIRSFRLNFEINLVIYGGLMASQVIEVFEKDLKHSSHITLDAFSQRPMPRKIVENACRLLSPLL